MIKEYPKDDVTIIWNDEKCIHCGFCAKGLPEVFKPRQRPWIQAENASKIAIITQVMKCPSGALTMKSKAG